MRDLNNANKVMSLIAQYKEYNAAKSISINAEVRKHFPSSAVILSLERTSCAVRAALFRIRAGQPMLSMELVYALLQL